MTEPNEDELRYWRHLWETHPLNGWWIRRGVERELALYVRIAVLAEQRPTPPLLAQVRGARGDLGLSATGAKSLGLVYDLSSETGSGDWWEA